MHHVDFAREDVRSRSCDDAWSRPTRTPLHTIILEDSRPSGRWRGPITASRLSWFSLVAFMPAPVASGGSGRRVGLAPTGKRRLVTAHVETRPWAEPGGSTRCAETGQPRPIGNQSLVFLASGRTSRSGQSGSRLQIQTARPHIGARRPLTFWTDASCLRGSSTPLSDWVSTP
jgi:hypothetical protein